VPVSLRLPAVLADLADGVRLLEVEGAPTTLGAMFDAVALTHPVLERRIRDETGAVRRFVNVYVDGTDARHLDGLDTPLPVDAEVTVLPSVAGG
jgi:molybdopterin converting factor small subunit